ncbi:pectate lyase superfamily protein-domain-containing protein [Podospora appendiculata]|uniref:Pectate lyase superfamily protein-domain-containing protein n=1 Tax=Podospora appendiculata TaxID=314037 RepID=A0AAE0X0Z1_9PEZI|nr:pectate lyase superfamily protein-domain-containing protein [Podospora appendiculata]
MRFASFLLAVAGLASAANAYWLGDIAHQGNAPFAGAGYSVFRNVKSYGAKGDGVTDDTDAINAAINAGNPCGQGCTSTTMTPALVYFPAGTYLISKSITPAYFTQLIGDANSPPTLKATANFAGFGLIDGNPYYTQNLNWKAVNVFFRQVRNFVIDTTNIPPGTAATGMHWPTSQATSLQNIVFNMPTATGVVHVGLFIEEGSGGFITDLTFNGGATGASIGNQQYTMRNLKFNNCKTAIIHLWDWGWTYQGLSINNCQVGIDISAGGSSQVETGSVTLLDSSFTNVGTAILTAWSSTSSPATAGSLVLENIALTNVPVAVQGPSGTLLSGSSGAVTIPAWGNGHSYTPAAAGGPREFAGVVTANARPAALLDNTGRYYTRSKPQYESTPASSFISVRSSGARGDGTSDDTAALQNAINTAVAQGKVLFLDYGLYRVTSTISIPPGAKIVGESYPTILSAGGFFNDINNPRPVLQVGATSGQPGCVELSDFVVSTQNAQAGAVLIEWNLAAPAAPSGMWDVHARIGGFTGSQQQVAQCLKTPGSAAVNPNCIVAFMAMHVTKGASGLYMENVWLWTADHDIDDAANTQITLYSGRGLFIESTAGTFWLYGTSSEHHALYQYQLAGTQNIFMGQIQTETPYYQPSPNALVPFSPVASLNDPDFGSSCAGVAGNCAAAWGLRVLNSKNVFVYGAGLYSFFSNYSTTCSTFTAGQSCQSRIVSLEGSVSNVNIYNLNTIGAQSMLSRDGAQVAYYNDNVNVFPSCVAVYKSG